MDAGSGRGRQKQGVPITFDRDDSEFLTRQHQMFVPGPWPTLPLLALSSLALPLFSIQPLASALSKPPLTMNFPSHQSADIFLGGRGHNLLTH